MMLVISRNRRLVAAVLTAVATALGAAAARPHTNGVRVPVAARDLADGAILAHDDIAVRTFPASVVPAGVLRVDGAARGAVGRTLSGAIRRGEPLTDARLRSGGLVDGRAPGLIATPIRLADAAIARLLHIGDHVDVLAARADGPLPARTIVAAAPVVAVPRRSPDVEEGALIVVSTDREHAAALARASVDSRLSVTIVGAG